MNLKLSLAFLLPTVALSCPIYNKLLEDLPIGNPCLADGKNDEEKKSQRTLQDQEVPELIPNTGPDYGGGALMVLKNNSLFHPQGIARPFYRDPQTGEGVAMADLIAHYTSGAYGESFPGVGKDLCYFTFQSLPPPTYIEDQSEVVPRTVDGVPQTFYNFPKSDMERYMYLGDLAVTRMTTQIEQGNPNILFGGCSSGSEASKALCAMNISGTEGSQCDDARSNSEVAWSQAIVIFKVDPENLDSLKTFVIDEWHGSVYGHLPNKHWAYPVFGEGEDLIASNYFGWGNNGGLRAKLVQCDKIDPKFIKPKGVNGNTVMGADAIDPSTGRTYGEEAYKEWDRLCGIPILGNPNSDCVIDADIPESAVEEEEPDNAEAETKSALLHFDEKCIYSNEYIDKSRACGTKLTAAWGDSTKLDMFEKELNELTAQCGVEFCDDRGYSGEQFFIDPSGFLHCGADEAPSECNGGITYMTALRDYGTCVLSAMEKVSTTKKEASAQALSESDAVLSTDAERSLESCESMIECEAKVASSITDEWSIKFCMNFFSALKDPDLNPDYDQFGWVADCGFGGDGTPESDVYKSCADLFINDADVEEDVAVDEPGTGDEETSSSSSFVYSMVVNTFSVLAFSAMLLSIN